VDYASYRKTLLAWLRKQLMGPARGQENLRGLTPLDRYPTGRLSPIVRTAEGLDPASVEDDEAEDFDALGAETSAPDQTKLPKRRRRYVSPSSVGFSFFAHGSNLQVFVSSRAARYRDIGRDEKGRFVSTEYERIELGSDDLHPFSATERRTIWPDESGTNLGGVDVLWRPYGDGWIITVSLYNNQELSEQGDAKTLSRQRNETTLFEVELRCTVANGEIGNYPRVNYSLLSDEEQDLELQYKHRHIYAIGHGAAANWPKVDGPVREVFTEFMPAVEVPLVTADVGSQSDRVLRLEYLCLDSNEPAKVLEELAEFVEGYAIWVSKQVEACDQLDLVEKAAGLRIVTRMDTTVSRMRRGIKLLRNDPVAFRAFLLANRSMLDQMRQSDRVRGRSSEKSGYKWRPFQLAFLLTVLESAIQENDDFRDTVDLIWFPTGGGKTEAYLGLIALLIVWRRLKHPTSGGGTTALMRYTLRLLTTQQYLRATRLICALELIRRQSAELGSEPITVGLWVGSASSPNTFDKAQECVNQATKGKASSLRSLVLEACPWCADQFRAPENFISTPKDFRFRCTNTLCDFGHHDRGVIPCNVVDEALYDQPPTLLIATIDKFARLAWEERVSAFFGQNGNRGPELIIQDELHLIAGALGSMAGIYEAALDTTLIGRGVYPKYIASTATIRMAELQVRRLYGRDLAVFPPPGLSCDDSYFARTVDPLVKPGRLYVGYLAPALDNQHCMAPLAAALLAAPEAVFRLGQIDREELLEAWWTQVVYHGSLKMVGNSHNAFNIDVRDHFHRLVKEAEESDAQESGDVANRQQKVINRLSAIIAQLTSISSPEENARTFSRLELVRGKPECLDAVLATNMVSVGLDVGRLALMVINGQPLTTAEYIQASSRVGRSDVPGIVVANYFRNQARSLSHYENFRPYHDSFYRFVEPTSVTPFTFQARTRALHAAIVIAVRHSCRFLLSNGTAGLFNSADDAVKKTIEILKRRCAQADPDRRAEIEAHIDRLVEQWNEEVRHCQSVKSKLNYQAPDNDKATRRLLFNHEDKIEGLWSTLQSMRNVENTALLKQL
jgi:hypothetical protein